MERRRLIAKTYLTVFRLLLYVCWIFNQIFFYYGDTKMRILFCNIGWMEKYQGLTDNDQISGGGSIVSEKGMGHEVCNFHSTNERVYGYVQPANDRSISLERIDENNQNNFLDNVLVIWLATRPKGLGGHTVIVGWYKNATVFKEFQHFKKIPNLQKENGISRYLIEAAAKDAVLLPVDARTFIIPRANTNPDQGGIGQSNIWYADQEKNLPIIHNVIEFIKQKESSNHITTKHTNKVNQERKVEVEKTAIQVCCAHFENLGYEIESVEKDNLGWDLVAKSGKRELRIEVKGLSGSVFSVELTPNEYKAFSEKKEDYRLAVVVNALKQPKLSVCRYSSERKAWIVETEDEADRLLEIKTKESASISCL